MNQRKLAIATGIVSLTVALYLGLKDHNDTPPTPNPQSTKQYPQNPSTTSARVTSPEKVSRLSQKNRATGITTDQAENEITRLLQDTNIPVHEASQALLRMAADLSISKEMRAVSLTHALNLVTNEEYQQMVQPYLEENFFEDSAMQRIVLDDAYNRDDNSKLPAALAIFSHTQGELHDDARELMAFIMDRDVEPLGDNHDAWRQAIADHLAKKLLESE